MSIDKNRLAKFDIVLSTFTFHHIPYEQQEKAIKNTIDLCRDDGKVIIVDRSFQNQEEKANKEKELEEKNNFEFLEVIRSEYYLLADSATRYIQYLGYRVETLFTKEQIWGFMIHKNPLTLPLRPGLS